MKFFPHTFLKYILQAFQVVQVEWHVCVHASMYLCMCVCVILVLPEESREQVTFRRASKTLSLQITADSDTYDTWLCNLCYKLP